MESRLCNCVLKVALTPSLGPSIPTMVLQGKPAVFSVTVMLQIAGQCVRERHTVPQKHLYRSLRLVTPIAPFSIPWGSSVQGFLISCRSSVLRKTQSFSIDTFEGHSPEKSQRLMQEMIQTLFLTSIMAKDADCLRKMSSLTGTFWPFYSHPCRNRSTVII